MVLLLTGASHTGKTQTAQKLLERTYYPYLSIDHLKMGLIGSGMIDLGVKDTAQLTELLWPLVVEIAKTAIENKQNLIIEGHYIPADYASYFSDQYVDQLCYIALIMSEEYISHNLHQIVNHREVIERRRENLISERRIKEENLIMREMVEHFDLPHVLIEDAYDQEKIVESILSTCKQLSNVVF